MRSTYYIQEYICTKPGMYVLTKQVPMVIRMYLLLPGMVCEHEVSTIPAELECRFLISFWEYNIAMHRHEIAAWTILGYSITMGQNEKYARSRHTHTNQEFPTNFC